MSVRHQPLDHRGVSGLMLRVRVGWAREDLDRRLAEGADPASDPLLDARAERLLTPASRASVAAGLERAVAAADKRPSPLSSAVQVRRSAVHGARHELMRLAGELRHMRAPRPCGVAKATRLMTDASSPLYTGSSSAEVACAAWEAAASMRPDTNPGDRGSLRTAQARAAGSPDHRFCTPTVVPLPAQPPVDSADW